MCTIYIYKKKDTHIYICIYIYIYIYIYMYYIYICVCMCKCASVCVLCICLLIFHTNYSDMCRYKKNAKIRSKIVKPFIFCLIVTVQRRKYLDTIHRSITIYIKYTHLYMYQVFSTYIIYQIVAILCVNLCICNMKLYRYFIYDN